MVIGLYVISGGGGIGVGTMAFAARPVLKVFQGEPASSGFLTGTENNVTAQRPIVWVVTESQSHLLSRQDNDHGSDGTHSAELVM